jgi:hypothetical protein
MSQRGGDPDPDGRGRRGDFTISASIGGIPCAVYYLHTSAQSLDFLELAKNASFLNWKLASAWNSFMDGQRPIESPLLSWSVKWANALIRFCLTIFGPIGYGHFIAK